MKKKRLLQLLVLGGLILALGIMPALGNTVTMNQDHSLALGLSGSANLAYVGFDNVFTYAFAQGFSSSPSGDVGPLSDTGLPTASVSGAYFPTTTATVGGYEGTGPYVMNQSMVANAISPFGSTSQRTENSISLIFRATSDGDASVVLTDTLTNMLYGASGPTVDARFISVIATTFFTANIFSDSNPGIPTNAQTLLDDIQVEPASYNFAGSISEISQVTFNLTGLTKCETVYLDLLLTSTLDTASVPVPPTVWLFGSGLVGLWSVRRRFSRS